MPHPNYVLSTADRFHLYVSPEPNTGCWLWLGAIDVDGYGAFRLPKTTPRAHRFSWSMHNGPIPRGLCVLHRCDNPGCVNPSHLFLGTNRDNIADRHAKGRDARGDRSGARLHPEIWRRGAEHHNAKLSWESVAEIRRLYGEIGASQAVLARHYNVSPTAIRLVVTRRTYV